MARPSPPRSWALLTSIERFHAVYPSIHTPLVGYALSVYGDAAGAEDAVQDAVRRLLQQIKCDTWIWNSNEDAARWQVRKYLSTSVFNLRREAFKRTPGLGSAKLVAITSDVVDPSSPPPGVDEFLPEILAHLPERQRKLLRLTYVEGLSGDEAARRMGMTGGACRVLLSRTLTDVRELLIAADPSLADRIPPAEPRERHEPRREGDSPLAR